MSSYEVTSGQRPDEGRLVHEIKQISRTMAEAGSNPVSPEQVQKLLALAVKLYILQLYDHPQLPPFGGDSSITATDVSMTVSGMLREADLQLFELAMWQGMRGGY